MATAHKPFVDEGLDTGVDAFVNRVHSTIEAARSKMTDEELDKADEEARAILNRASAAAKSSRHRA